MGHELNLVPDYTLAIQLGMFFVCYFVLKYFVFNPYLNLLELREAKTHGLDAKAVEAEKKAIELEQTLDHRLKSERQKLNHWVDEQRKVIVEKERKALQEAREQAQSKLQVEQLKFQDQKKQAAQNLEGKVTEFSNLLLGRLLKREVSIHSASTEKKSQAATVTEL